jgi:hypothetical protein
MKRSLNQFGLRSTRAGEQMRNAWEEFFSAAEKTKETSEPPILSRPEEQKLPH